MRKIRDSDGENCAGVRSFIGVHNFNVNLSYAFMPCSKDVSLKAFKAMRRALEYSYWSPKIETSAVWHLFRANSRQISDVNNWFITRQIASKPEHLFVTFHHIFEAFNSCHIVSISRYVFRAKINITNQFAHPLKFKFACLLAAGGAYI